MQSRPLKLLNLISTLIFISFSMSLSAALIPADLIIKGKYVVTMDPDSTIIKEGAVVVKDSAIIAIGSQNNILSHYRAKKIIEGKNRVVMPGLINGHSHAAMTLLRGIAEDLSLHEWLNKYIFPAEVKFVDANFVRIGTELACWEMIRGGTTTFVDMYYFPDTVAKVVAACGMRAQVAATVIDQKSPDAKNATDSLAKAMAFIKRWKGKNPRIKPILGPHSNYTLNAEQLVNVRNAAIKSGVGISIHMSEAPYEIQHAKNTYGTTSIKQFANIGLLDVPVIGAHVVLPTTDEIPLLVKYHVGVINNPTSNMKSAAGIAPITEMLAAGVNVGLGTDGAASNNDLDMWEEIRLAALLQKVHHLDPTVLPAETVLRMATSGGARAIGMDTEIGSLEIGKQADIIQLSFDDVHFIPSYNVISQLVYVADEQDVVNVVIAGRLVMEERDILTIDIQKVRMEATTLARKIKQSLYPKK